MKIRGNTIGTPIKPEKNLVKATDLTEEEKAQARANLGVSDTPRVFEFEFWDGIQVHSSTVEGYCNSQSTVEDIVTLLKQGTPVIIRLMADQSNTLQYTAPAWLEDGEVSESGYTIIHLLDLPYKCEYGNPEYSSGDIAVFRECYDDNKVLGIRFVDRLGYETLLIETYPATDEHPAEIHFLDYENNYPVRLSGVHDAKFDTDAVNLRQLNAALGDISTALDAIIAKQRSLMRLITFTINGVEYTAVEGMNWDEWIVSEYNTCSAIIQSNYVYVRDSSGNLKQLKGPNGYVCIYYRGIEPGQVYAS